MQLKAKIFEFVSYEFSADQKRIFFDYKTILSDGKKIFFREAIIFPKKIDLKTTADESLRKILGGLHMILGVSYYKLHCAPEVKLPYELSEKEAQFWNEIYKKGLGEFFYRNNLDPKISPKFPVSNKKNTKILKNFTINNKVLLGMGGGKDSIVAVELLKNSGFETTPFLVKRKGAHCLTEEVIKKTGLKDVLEIERILDKKINQKYPYNGHVPVSAIYAFLGVAAAFLFGYRYVVVGNEQSSNFGNLEYKGLEINHQWSKSFEFEKLFQDYVGEFVVSGIFYFSLLRPFYEIRIAKMFSEMKKYFPVFFSCNKNFSSKNILGGELWCNKCAKCVFVFIVMSAFLEKKDLLKIFGRNLYEDKKLFPIFNDVLGLGDKKPFDCVGTFEEAQTALFLAKKNFSGDFIVKEFGKIANYHKKVFLTSRNNNIPEQFKFLGMKNVLILGYGVEGKTTEKYFKKYYPWLNIGIGDEKKDKNYMERQINFDIAIKTPGINKNLVKIPHTTATNMFFSVIKEKNMIIGVTGSKGKSTTTSLIYQILKNGGKQVELLGNIGKPMLERLLSPVKKSAIFVLELSSFQLDDIGFSPDISVVTNLFPEHMNYHGSVENYYLAKKNIIKFQREENFFVYNPECAAMSEWLKNYRGKAVPFSKDIPISDNDIPLLGEHNKNNVKAAVAVAKIIGISDKAIFEAVKNFKGLPHRLEFIGKYGGLRFYDDAISTAPESTIMAIKSVPNIGVIFLGGEDRGYDFSLLEKTIRKHKIKNIVLFPESGKRILKSRKDFNVLETSDMKKAVEFAFNNAKKGSACLLSCASPSYSLWENFERKGNKFKEEVIKISVKQK